MDFQIQNTKKCAGRKRSCGSIADDETETKKQKLLQDVTKTTPTSNKNVEAVIAHQSPKKRLELVINGVEEQLHSPRTSQKEKFIYGNYKQYYGYRNKGKKDFHDIRLDVFESHRGIFESKDVLDIGCNSGFVTMAVAKGLSVKSIIGLDIDRSLINQANKNLLREKKSLQLENTEEIRRLKNKFPYNVRYVHGNYVLIDAVLLEIEQPQFDLILCLSITKWIHLNFGDTGLKQAFRRIFLQLRTGGKLILEAQSFENYGRRKKMTDTIFSNYKSIKFFPQDFTTYLLSTEVGFQSVELMGVPEHCVSGFKRPIQIFTKV